MDQHAWSAFVAANAFVVNCPIVMDRAQLAQELHQLVADDRFERNQGDLQSGNPRFYEVRSPMPCLLPVTDEPADTFPRRPRCGGHAKESLGAWCSRSPRSRRSLSAP